MREIDFTLDLPGPPMAVGEPLAPAPTGPIGDASPRSGEEAESFEALYRTLLEKERRLVSLLSEQERRLEAQVVRERRLEGILAPSEEEQRARYARLNEFLRQVMERSEHAAATALSRAEAAAEQPREQARRDCEAWRRTSGRRLSLLAGTIALLLACQAVAVGYALWR
jgi:hypothetical protein